MIFYGLCYLLKENLYILKCVKIIVNTVKHGFPEKYGATTISVNRDSTDIFGQHKTKF